ncbi:MAG: hypothetical protein NVSMB62_25100 [Acidobacteriaceae bacterium]
MSAILLPSSGLVIKGNEVHRQTPSIGSPRQVAVTTALRSFAHSLPASRSIPTGEEKQAARNLNSVTWVERQSAAETAAG